ncbi:putative F-box domain, leucine-rich repeat domain superfamily, F-box-like domain superfamily [Helianthus annuus]|uniref:F-box domain, leucine-rich repeat domain superfamily, F-box-like domain superfamily n=1 Tax=Helianthus annuus TaxID=4232 RepID=A0A9K3IRV1_HELAN|nr:putative F-box domain, leucine-rich repeat domain superfamily, F-box-like domain superfamily [Helianthus annuus]KAJ0566111.1 putative F-box domain, leucine-rich repeat domain superfamily, F-box-like domain superfamily [Helianthus annuus]KAJ0572941.1 putative F-box domain-containing protein [Helianthus annuus]KAJ0737378.1 putative F-box domain-containing protein [Helianthus annuus]KAJ0911167.1 putative F-box domain, leucine-rich repeat domain superfamily, F-box-like domain superfamily [Helian
MESRRDRMRMDAEGDRLSVLPDDLILQILSFVGLKDAIGTSVLSSRWRYLWTSIPHLSFSSQDSICCLNLLPMSSLVATIKFSCLLSIFIFVKPLARMLP